MQTFAFVILRHARTHTLTHTHTHTHTRAPALFLNTSHWGAFLPDYTNCQLEVFPRITAFILENK